MSICVITMGYYVVLILYDYRKFSQLLHAVFLYYLVSPKVSTLVKALKYSA